MRQDDCPVAERCRPGVSRALGARIDGWVAFRKKRRLRRPPNSLFCRHAVWKRLRPARASSEKGRRPLPRGQVPKLDNLEGRASVVGLWTGAFACWNSSSSSFLICSIWRRSKPVTPIDRHFSRSPGHGPEHQ